MKSFKDSTLDYKCVTGCGVSIFNATHGYKDNKCPECGGKLKKMKGKEKKNEG